MFQRWAARFPLTRPIARHRAGALFDLCAGFVYAQVLRACVRLDLCPILAKQPQRADEVAARLGLAHERAQCLLDAAASLRLVVRRRDGRYGIGTLGAALIGNPGVMAMIEHHGRFYADLADPVALLRNPATPGALAAYWPYAHARDPTTLGDAEVAPYSRLMAVSQPLIAAEVLDAYSFRHHHCLLDVGGGEGAFLAEAGARWPALRLVLFDLPAVARLARERLAGAGLGKRATCIGGDFRHDDLPGGADVISVIRVLHDHDDETVLSLLRAIRRALRPGGRLLVAEPMSGTKGAAPVTDAYFGFYLLAMGSGRPRSAAALATMMQQAGFIRPRLLRTAQPMITRLMIAEVS